MTNIQLDTNSLVSIQNNQITTTSKIIASVFEKNHSHVLRDIDNIISKVSDNFRKSNFGFTSETVSMPKGAKRQDRICILTKDGLVMLVMGYTGTEAIKFKEAYINAFNEMAKQLESQKQPKLHSLENNIKTLEQNNKALCQAIAIYENQLPKEMAKKLCNLVKAKVNENKHNTKAKSYAYIWNKLKNYFDVTEYREIPSLRFGEAVEFIATLQIPKFLDAEQIDLLEPVRRKNNLASVISDEEAEQAIYIKKIAPQVMALVQNVISNSETLLMKNSVGRVQFLDATLQDIKEKSNVIQALLKSA